MFNSHSSVTGAIAADHDIFVNLQTCSFLPPTPDHRHCDPMASPWENYRIITLHFDEGGGGHARVCELV